MSQTGRKEGKPFMDRTQKKQLRRQLQVLLAIDDYWYQKPETNLYQQIILLGEKLSGDPCVWKKRTINKEQYLEYTSKGYALINIANKFNVSPSTLRKWREEHNLL